jgi:adenylate kinase
MCRRPIFRITVLYVDEAESVRRQLLRGKKARENNEIVKNTGQGEMLMERVTDADETVCLLSLLNIIS